MWNFTSIRSTKSSFSCLETLIISLKAVPISCRPGDILLTSSRDIHRPVITPGKPYERYVIWMEDDFFARFQDWGDDLSACFNDTARKKYQLIRPDSSLLARLKQHGAYMAQVKAEQHFGSRTLLYACLLEFLVYLNRAYFDTPDSIRHDITENGKDQSGRYLHQR